jgi:probable phosphoglycerate mutase
VHENVERILAAIAALSDEERCELFERLSSEAGFPPTSRSPLPLESTSVAPQTAADFTIIFDGGSQGNPGAGYGSYALTRADDGRQEIVRLDFGRVMTNNEAEYETLIAGLQGLAERIEASGQSPSDVSVEARGDSALVIHQVEGTWETKDDRMRLLRSRVCDLLRRFKAHRLVLQGREESVRVLGH